MTAILGMIDASGKCWIAGDRALSGDDAFFTSSRPKVFRSGPWLVGCSGDVRAQDALRDAFATPPRTERELRRCFDQFKSKTEDWSALVLGRRRIRYVEGGGALSPIIARTAAVGSGEHMALGALRGMLDGRKTSPRDMLRRALKICSGYTHYVKPPFDVLEEGKTTPTSTRTMCWTSP